MSQKVLKVHPSDNVIVALQDIASGDEITYNGKEYTIKDDIQAKHKFFAQDLASGQEVIMYGVLIGTAQLPLQAGALMTTTNVKHASGKYDYRGVKYSWSAPDVAKFKGRTFNGYHRSNGQVGTANYWLFIPTVFCENRNLDVIKEALHNELGYAVTDKYKSYTHQLIEAYKEGKDFSSVDIFSTPQHE